jgi:condensin complex subunit 3
MTALHILTDILNVHGSLLLTSTPGLLKVYLKAVKGNAKSAEVQAAATVAATKLLLGRVVSDPEASHDLLKSLVVAYFDPASAHNQTVRQALNYFLPVFCYSRPENQDLMRSVALEALHTLLNVRENFEDDDVDVDENMVSLNTIGACLVDWTDPRKCYTPDLIPDADKRNVNGDVHLELAMDILERLNSNISSKLLHLTG